MSFSNNLGYLLLTILATLTINGFSSIIEVQNNCNYDIWAAAVPGSGKHLSQNEIWTISPPNKKKGEDYNDLYIWGRTNCTFNNIAQGKCVTGDCDGLFNCQDGFINGRDKGRTFATLAYFRLNRFDESEQHELDNFGISILDGYNIPMQLTAICDQDFTSIIGFKYTTSINGHCPSTGNIEGCNKYCTVLKNEQNCYQTCQNKLNKPADCPEKDPRSILGKYDFPSGGNHYKVLFCP